MNARPPEGRVRVSVYLESGDFERLRTTFGRNRKAEAAKLPGAGIWPEAVPRKISGRKGLLTKPVGIGRRSTLA